MMSPRNERCGNSVFLWLQQTSTLHLGRSRSPSYSRNRCGLVALALSAVFHCALLKHPLPDVGQAVHHFDIPCLTGTQKPNCIDVHNVYFIQIQNDPWPTVLDLGAQVIELLRSKFTAQVNPRPPFPRNSLHSQCHLVSPVAKCKGEALRGSSTGARKLSSRCSAWFSDSSPERSRQGSAELLRQ